jgi:hypothetical protein
MAYICPMLGVNPENKQPYECLGDRCALFVPQWTTPVKSASEKEKWSGCAMMRTAFDTWAIQEDIAVMKKDIDRIERNVVTLARCVSVSSSPGRKTYQFGTKDGMYTIYNE